MNAVNRPTDEALVARYAKGDNAAFDELLKRYQQKIYTYIYCLVHNEDLANDLFQETFVKAIVTIQQGRYVESGRFSAWLTRIAHNLIVDQYRQERNANTISNDETEADLFNEVELADTNIEMQMVNNQSLEDVKQLMDELPKNQREVVFMRFFQDLSFKEIAEATGVSINTALGRLRYALLNMRRMIDERNIALALY